MPRGGKRSGAGRPKGQGKFGEKTKAIRVPLSLVDEVLDFAKQKGYKLPLYSSRVSAGFPSPADDHMERTLDLNDHLIQHPTATFFVRVSGDSMIKAGIHPDDILIVDRSLKAVHGKVIVAALDGQLTVKRLYKKPDKAFLMPENDKYSPIPITEESEIYIWGVVTNVIHKV